jgi:ribosomal protein S18 acetylase RimI-like enzyme
VDLEDRWINAFVRMNNVEKHAVTFKAMVQSLVQPTCFSHIEDRGRIVACGMAVLEQNVVWLFDITVHEDFQRRGFGTQLIYSLLRWGKNSNADQGYLQVMRENKPALALYKKLGFKELYKYWYRTRGQPR